MQFKCISVPDMALVLSNVMSQYLYLTQNIYNLVDGGPEWSRVVHLDVEDCSEKLLRQQSYAIKNQLGHPEPPTRGFGTQNSPIGANERRASTVLDQ